MPFPTHREKFPTAEAPKRGTHVPRRLLCSRYGAMQLQRVPSCHQSVGFTFCPCSGLLPLPPGSRRRALACPASLPRPVRLPASRLRPAPAPPVSVMRRPGLAVLRKRRRQRSAPSCPFPSITARMPFPLRQRPLSPVCAHGPAATSRRPFSVPAAEKETFLSFPVKGVIIFLYYQYVIDCFRKKFSFFPQDTLIPATTKAENFSTLM